MTLPALSDMTVEQAAAAAAELAVYPRYGHHTKVAFELPEIITNAAGTLRDKGTELWKSVADSSIGQSVGEAAGKARSAITNSDVGQRIGKGWEGLSPETRQSLSRVGLGAAIGGGIGLGSGIVRRKRPIGGAVTGALAGGAVGAGYDLIDRSGLVKEMLGKGKTPPAGPPVEYSRPDGSTGKIDMAKYRDLPEDRRQQVQDIMKNPSKGSRTGEIADTVTFGLTGDSRVPTVTPMAGAAYTARKIYGGGAVIPEASTNAHALRAGLDASSTTETVSERAKATENVVGNNTGESTKATGVTGRSTETKSMTPGSQTVAETKTMTPGRQVVDESKLTTPGPRGVSEAQEVITPTNQPSGTVDRTDTTKTTQQDPYTDTSRTTKATSPYTDASKTTKVTSPYTDEATTVTDKTDVTKTTDQTSTSGAKSTGTSGESVKRTSSLPYDDAIEVQQRAFMDKLRRVSAARNDVEFRQLLSDFRRHQDAGNHRMAEHYLGRMDPELRDLYRATGRDVRMPINRAQALGEGIPVDASNPLQLAQQSIMRQSLLQRVRRTLARLPLGERAQQAIRGDGSEFVNLAVKGNKLRTLGHGLGLTGLGMLAEYGIRDKIMKAREAANEQALLDAVSWK
jgi:hypothetical protein